MDLALIATWWVLQATIGGVALVCYIVVLVKLFKHNETTMAWVCLASTPCGIGAVMLLIYGWSMAKEWELSKTMIVWTAAIVVSLLVQIGGPRLIALVPGS